MMGDVGVLTLPTMAELQDCKAHFWHESTIINFEMIGRDEIPSAHRGAVEQKEWRARIFPGKGRKARRQSLAVPSCARKQSY